MSETPVELRGGSSIEWTDYTFNPWIGCARVSAACRFCYAETWNARYQRAVWGEHGTRTVTADSNWRKPYAWNAKASADGVRRRVFCASLADVFEDRPDLEQPRARLFEMIEATTSLDWLLLTKRPENIRRLSPPHWLGRDPSAERRLWPRHVWVGTTVEDQASIPRIIDLHLVKAPVRFLSVEPMLSHVDLTDVLADHLVDWVICGGESGPHARAMDPAWARSLRDQCVTNGVPFLFKQWGEHDEHGDRVGKKAAGRLLDGELWDQYPTPDLGRAR